MNRINSTRGSVLLLTLLVSTLLSIMSISAITITTANLMTSNAFKNDKSAFYLAEAGISHAREILRATGGMSFSEKLKIAAGDNNKLDGDDIKSDDVPIVDTDFANGHYTVYLLNDSIDDRKKLNESNNMVMLRSIGVSSSGISVMLEATVHKLGSLSASSYDAALPGSITLLGKSSTVTVHMNKKPKLSGNESRDCGGHIAPIFAVSDDISMKNVMDSIKNSYPEKYKNKDNDDIVKNIQHTISVIKESQDIDLNTVSGLKKLVSNLSKGADIIISEEKDSLGIDLGNKKNMKIILAEGDFTLKKNGAGMLIVKGHLRIEGNVKYDGLIVVIGEGSIKMTGNGHIFINGGLLISNINNTEAGVDEEKNTADDDEPGAANLDMVSSGSITISLCSSNILNAVSLIPPAMVAFCDETCLHHSNKKSR